MTMVATRIDGNALAAEIKTRIRAEVEKLPRKPGLAVILVGDNPASQIYVSHKKKDCELCGFLSEEYVLGADTPQEELMSVLHGLNTRGDIDGILVQLPLPENYDEQKILMEITPDKDVDGFHPMNAGTLFQGGGGLLPCTPSGVMEMLRAYNIDPAGKHCVVVGRSNIVGKPMAILLTQADGTVTICHSKTPNLAEICRQADILVSAVGRVGLVTADMIKPGATVVDVAVNRKEDGKLCGDVCFDEVSEKAAFITPVPGGVGPMTRAMLMQNTLLAAKRHLKIDVD